MPLTPLFPKDWERIEIQQGRIGDCYLLATIDCITNSSAEGRQQFKSLFSQSADGVTVRIKDSKISPNLKLKQIQEGQYAYSRDDARGEDVFFISNKRLQEIDSADSIGAKSNSLGVKILEHLSAYYFSANWTRKPAMERMASLLAHSELSVNRHGMSSPSFVSHLLGVATDTIDLDQLIKLKKIYPDFPTFVHMVWGQGPERHALRVDRIKLKKDSTTEYDLHLVNPWNNTVIETRSSDALKKADPFFFIFSPSKEEIYFVYLLIALPDDDVEFLASAPPSVMAFIKQQSVAKNNFSHADMQKCINLYRVMPNFLSIYANMSPGEQKAAVDSLYATYSYAKKPELIGNLIQSSNLSSATLKALIKEATLPELVDHCLKISSEKLFTKLIGITDILPQIAFTTLDTGVFLTDLLYLELKQAVPNKERLYAIAEFIKAYNTEFKTNLADKYIKKFYCDLKPNLAEILDSQVAGVVLPSVEAQKLQDQIKFLIKIEKMKHSANFDEQRSFRKLEERRIKVLKETEDTFKDANFLREMQAAGLNEADKLKEWMSNRINKAAAEQADRLNLVAINYHKYVSFPVNFSEQSTVEQVQSCAQKYIEELERNIDGHYVADMFDFLGITMEEGREIVKSKKEDINELAQIRINEIKASNPPTDNPQGFFKPAPVVHESRGALDTKKEKLPGVAPKGG